MRYPIHTHHRRLFTPRRRRKTLCWRAIMSTAVPYIQIDAIPHTIHKKNLRGRKNILANKYSEKTAWHPTLLILKIHFSMQQIAYLDPLLTASPHSQSILSVSFIRTPAFRHHGTCVIKTSI